MRTPEQWQMVVQVERELLSERAARRIRLGPLPEPAAGQRWPIRVRGPRPRAWLGWVRAHTRVRVRRRQPGSGFGGV